MNFSHQFQKEAYVCELLFQTSHKLGPSISMTWNQYRIILGILKPELIHYDFITMKSKGTYESEQHIP
jgi:hypothetical protein